MICKILHIKLTIGQHSSHS